ncbi:hypothetical protein [Cohnella faecalis]|uniref:Efflux RND transporter permease subunit n=1 Tax=Cohnella faecalis TaxID=2315694 RepID=A0A398CEP2_9BACL|nr:hypothetical protein [Cohnella faecalis]RIE01636.1 hypothetical protein D3H35_25185 [Cohnella faecalis]
MESYLKELNETESYSVSIGSSGGNPLASSGGKNKATVTAQFVDGTDIDQLVDRMNTELPAIVTPRKKERRSMSRRASRKAW